MIVAFQRYQFWPVSIMWDGRYGRNKDRPYHDPVPGVSQKRITIECLVPLSSKFLATSDVSVRRRLGCLKVIPRLQTSFPPMVHNCQTYFLNISINTAPFSYDSNGAVIALKISFKRYIIRSEMLRGSREKACKQNFGNFRFSASRVSVGMKVIPLESYELAVFYGIIASTFGVLLKFYA